MSVTKNCHISVFLISVIPILYSDFFIASRALKCHPCCSHPCMQQFLSKLLHSAAFLDVKVCPETLETSAGIKACLKTKPYLLHIVLCWWCYWGFFKYSFIIILGLTLAQISLPRCTEIFLHLQTSIVWRNQLMA